MSLIDIGAPEKFLAPPFGGERAERELFLPSINRDLTVGAWPLADQSFVFRQLGTGSEVGRLPSAPGEVIAGVWSEDDRYFAVIVSRGLQ